MDNGKKIIFMTIIVGLLLITAYCVVCSMWFVASVKRVVAKCEGLEYGSMRIVGLNKVMINDLTLDVPVPVDIRLDQVIISSDKKMFLNDVNYGVTINVSECAITLRSSESTDKGTAVRYAVDPFVVSVTVREKGIKVVQNTCNVENYAQIEYAVDLYNNYLTAFLTVRVKTAHISDQKAQALLQEVFDLTRKDNQLSIRLDGELPLVRVEIRSPRIEMDFAYSTQKTHDTTRQGES